MGLTTASVPMEAQYHYLVKLLKTHAASFLPPQQQHLLHENPAQGTILIFLFPLAILVFFASILRRRRRRPPFPPSPPSLPFIGHMHMMDQLTHRGLAKLAADYGSKGNGLLHLRLGQLNAFAVSTPSAAQQVLQAQDQAFSNRPATAAIRYLTYDRNDMAFAHYGPFWRQIRKLCVVRLFSRRRALTWACVREEVEATTRDIANAVKSDPSASVNVGFRIFNLTNNIIFRAAFGTSTTETEQTAFVAIIQEFSRLFGAFNIGDFIPWLQWYDHNGLKKRLKKARAALDRFIDTIIDDHIAKPKPADAPDADMVDDMLAFLEDPNSKKGAAVKGKGDDDLQGTIKLTRDNIKAIIMDVMFGGTETVASAVEWALAELMHTPSALRRVQDELSAVVGLNRKVTESDIDKLTYLKCCIKETLRLHPPIPLLLHETAEDCEVNGFNVPAKSRVMINVWAIDRDPEAWKDPEVFRPGRFMAEDGGEAAGLDFKGGDFQFLPFGSGRRSCPGMQLGLYGLELAVAQLVHCFEWTLPNGMKPEELDMGDLFGLTAPRATRLVAVPKPRLTCPLL